MRIKLLLFGEAISIPHTSIGFGIGLVSVWIDGNGFTSASNDLGSLGYILLETQDVDIGELDPERQELFSNLHARTVFFEIAPNHFVRSDGIARITMTISTTVEGNLADRKIEFLAEDCTGVSFVTNPLRFATEMVMIEGALGWNGGQTVTPEDALAAIIEGAPTDGDGIPA